MLLCRGSVVKKNKQSDVFSLLLPMNVPVQFGCHFLSLSVLNSVRWRRALFTISSVSQRLKDNDQNGNVYTDFVAIIRYHIIQQCI